MERCKPVYKEFDGWTDDISKVREYKDLPESARKYIETIEEITGAKISMIGVGPNRDEAVLVKNPYDE
mgnify:FL=1